MIISSGGGAVQSAAPAAETNTGVETSGSVGEDNDCWLFMHLQKTGGSTVKGILSDRWKPRYAIYDSLQWKAGEHTLNTFGEKLREGDRWSVLAGGYTEALRRSNGVDERCRFFTVFRHPITRMVSAYYYCKRWKNDPVCASSIVNANDIDLLAFAKHWGNFAMRQFALNLVSADDVMEYSKTNAVREKLPEAIEDVRKLPGWYLLKMYLDDKAPDLNDGDDGFIPDAAMYEMVQPLQDLIRDNYTAVGILEEFNTTLSLFDAALAMPEVRWHGEFNSQGKLLVDSVYREQEALTLLEAWTDSEVKKYMQLDIVLYEHAVDVFHQQIQAYGIE